MTPNEPTENEYHLQATIQVTFRSLSGHNFSGLNFGPFQVTFTTDDLILTGSSVGSIHEYQSIGGDMKSGKQCQWKED